MYKNKFKLNFYRVMHAQSAFFKLVYYQVSELSNLIYFLGVGLFELGIDITIMCITRARKAPHVI